MKKTVLFYCLLIVTLMISCGKPKKYQLIFSPERNHLNLTAGPYVIPIYLGYKVKDSKGTITKTGTATISADGAGNWTASAESFQATLGVDYSIEYSVIAKNFTYLDRNGNAVTNYCQSEGKDIYMSTSKASFRFDTGVEEIVSVPIATPELLPSTMLALKIKNMPAGANQSYKVLIFDEITQSYISESCSGKTVTFISDFASGGSMRFLQHMPISSTTKQPFNLQFIASDGSDSFQIPFPYGGTPLTAGTLSTAATNGFCHLAGFSATAPRADQAPYCFGSYDRNLGTTGVYEANDISSGGTNSFLTSSDCATCSSWSRLSASPVSQSPVMPEVVFSTNFAFNVKNLGADTTNIKYQIYMDSTQLSNFINTYTNGLWNFPEKVQFYCTCYNVLVPLTGFTCNFITQATGLTAICPIATTKIGIQAFQSLGDSSSTNSGIKLSTELGCGSPLPATPNQEMICHG